MKVLFIGNSYTFFNSLPQAVAALAAAAGASMAIDEALSGGKDLQWHWEEGEGRAKLASGAPDFVVLQDHSLGAIHARDKLFDYSRRFAAEIRSHGAQPVFFMTWARRFAPETQAFIADAYSAIARELAARLAPAGIAWQRSLAARPDIVLHMEDGSHPTPQGSYLAACVLMATLLGESFDFRAMPAVVESGGKTLMRLSEQEAAFLQKTAWETVRETRQP
jgi:hypothetical protein